MELTANLKSLSLPSLVGGGRDGLFLRWGKALHRCLPRPIKRWIARRNPVLVVIPEAAEARLERALGDEREVLGALALEGATPVTAAVGDAARRGFKATLLELPPDRVLVRELTLPVQVRDNLSQVLAYEIDRLTPFTADQVSFDAIATGTVARGTKLNVRLAVAPREQLTTWLARLRQGGSPATRVAWPGAWPEANLLPLADRPKPQRFRSLASALLLLFVVGAAAAVLVTPLWQKTQVAEQEQRALRKLKIAAAEVAEVRAELERTRQGSLAVIEAKQRQPRMTELLRELTDGLDDDTWVQTLNVRGKKDQTQGAENQVPSAEVQLRGESKRATALIQVLENARGFDEVSFRSPVMQVASSGKERYHISLKYQRPEPEIDTGLGAGLDDDDEGLEQ